jgi:hypothetical protein
MRVTMAATTGHKSLRLFSERLNSRNTRGQYTSRLVAGCGLKSRGRSACDTCPGHHDVGRRRRGCRRRLMCCKGATHSDPLHGTDAIVPLRVLRCL